MVAVPDLLASVPAGVQVIRDRAGVEGLAEAWEFLADGAPGPLQHYPWIRSCAAAFAKGANLHVLVVGPREAPVAGVPLARRRDGRLVLLGGEELGEATDIPARDPRGLDLLATALQRSGSPVVLHRIPAESAIIPALRRAYRGRGVVIVRPRPGCPWIPLAAGFPPDQQLSARRRSDLRRAARRAESFGVVTSEILSPAPAALEPILREAFCVEAAGWKGRRGSALERDPLRRAFFRRYAAEGSQEGELRVCFLRIDGRAAAMQLAMERDQRFWLLKIGYDEAFARCSPGMLLMQATLHYAAARGLHSLEFLGETEPWTRLWTARERPCVSVRTYPGTTWGLAAMAADAAAVTGRRLGRLLRSRHERAAARRVPDLVAAAS